MRDPEHGVIAERSAEDLVSPAPLLAQISRVDIESRGSGQKLDTAVVSSAHSLMSTLSPQGSNTLASGRAGEKRGKPA